MTNTVLIEGRTWRTGVTDPEELRELSGLEIIERMGQGDLPMPPMAGVLPLTPHAWERGRVEFRARPEAGFANPMGSVHGGWTMTMLDTAMAVAAHTTLAAGEVYASIDTAVRFTRAIFESVGEMRVFGEVLARGRTIITCTGRLEDGSGKLYATGTSSCLVSRMPAVDASDAIR